MFSLSQKNFVVLFLLYAKLLSDLLGAFSGCHNVMGVARNVIMDVKVGNNGA
jgi:hypothetical protein